MKNLPLCLSVALLGIVSFVAPATAQKGTGEPAGVARQAVKPPVETMSGTIKEIKTGRCEHTTGRFVEGVHLIVQAQDNRTINLHLGPASPLADVVKKLSAGETITFEAFRTDRMPKDAYVAKTLNAGGETFALRNDSLRPKWAGRGWGMGGGRGMGVGAGFGQGSCYW
jgi:hypothetical protein